MKPLLSTYTFSDNASMEEKMEQSNARLEALKKIVDYIDEPINNQMGKIMDEFIKESDFDEHDWDKLGTYNKLRYDFFAKALMKAKEEQRKAELKIKIICLLFKKVNCHFNTYSDFEENFPGETEKSTEKAIMYGYYILDNVSSGRSIEDILKLPFDKICEIAKCEHPERWEEIEQFVFKNKVGIQYLKRIIQVVNENGTANLDNIFEQAKNETKTKREDKKAGTYEHKRYIKMKTDYRLMTKLYEHTESELKKSEYLRKKYQRRSEKYAALYKKLKEYVKQFKKFKEYIIPFKEFLKSKNINFDSLENLPLQIFNLNITAVNPVS